jgi:hypothetical protein
MGFLQGLQSEAARATQVPPIQGVGVQCKLLIGKRRLSG